MHDQTHEPEPTPKLCRWLLWLNITVVVISVSVPAVLRLGKLLEQRALVFEPYSAARLAQLQADGHPVLVHVTADWFMDGGANVFHRADVRRAIRTHNCATLKANHTQPSRDTRNLVQSLHELGSPNLILIYPADPQQPAIRVDNVFSQEDLLTALQKAAAKPPL